MIVLLENNRKEGWKIQLPQMGFAELQQMLREDLSYQGWRFVESWDID